MAGLVSALERLQMPITGCALLTEAAPNSSSAVADRFKTTPGVESAGLAATIPFGMVSLGKDVQPAGATAEKPRNFSYNVVSGDYFATLDIPLLRGRTFQHADAAEKGRSVAILDKEAAHFIWPNTDALGKHIHILGEGAEDMPDVEVVGIVGNDVNT